MEDAKRWSLASRPLPASLPAPTEERRPFEGGRGDAPVGPSEERRTEARPLSRMMSPMESESRGGREIRVGAANEDSLLAINSMLTATSLPYSLAGAAASDKRCPALPLRGVDPLSGTLDPLLDGRLADALSLGIHSYDLLQCLTPLLIGLDSNATLDRFFSSRSTTDGGREREDELELF